MAETCVRGPCKWIVKRTQNLILLFGGQGREFGNTGKHLTHSGEQFRQAFPVGLLFFNGEGGQATINEIDNAGLTCSGGIVGGDDPRSDRLDLLGFFLTEEVELGRRSGLRGKVRMASGSKEGRPMRGDPDSRKSSGPLG